MWASYHIHWSLCAILLLMGVLDFIFWRRADRLARALPAPRAWRGALALFMVSQLGYLALMAFAPEASRRSRGGIPIAWHSVSYTWHILILLPSLLAALGWNALARLWGRKQATPPAPLMPPEIAPRPIAPAGVTRRRVLAAAAAAVPPLVATGWGLQSVYSMRGLRVRAFTLFPRTLPAALDGTTIALVTDTHVGKFLRQDRLPDIAEKVNQLGADFVVFAGDLIDLSLDDLPLGIDFLRRLKPRHGLVVCEGNHDIVHDRGVFEKKMGEAGCNLLLGGVARMNARALPLQFVGLPWNHDDAGHEGALRSVRPQIDPDLFPVVLAHHPHAFDAAAAAGLPLTLSGHTHGGQIMLTPRLGGGPVRFRYWSGHYQKADSSLVVSNGIGNWFPVRMNAPAEIIHLTLKSRA